MQPKVLRKDPRKTTAVVSMISGALSRQKVHAQFGVQDAAYLTGKNPHITIEVSQLSTMRGSIDHETAHVRYTWITDGQLRPKKPEGLLGTLENIVEDARINRLISNEYPGCRTNLTLIYSKMFKISSAVTIATSNQREFLAILHAIQYMTIEHQWRNSTVARLAERTVNRAIVKRIPRDIVQDTKQIATFTDVRSVAKKLLDWMKPMVEQNKQQASGQRPAQSDGKGNPFDEEEQDEQDDTADQGQAQPASAVGLSINQQDALKMFSQVMLIKDSVFNKEVKEPTGDFTDTLIVEPLPEHQRLGQPEASEVRAQIGNSLPSASVKEALRARVNANCRIHSRGSQVAPSRLYRAAMGDNRLFLARAKKPKYDTVASLLIDSSGSMMGVKSTTASFCASLFSDCLTAAQITHEVIGFTTDDHQTCQPYPPSYRTAPVKHLVMKSYADRELRPYTGQSHHRNCDSDTLLFTAQGLLHRPERRKVIFVVSDGRPNFRSSAAVNDGSLLASAVTMIEGTGITVIGIGVQCEYGRDYYKRYIEFNSLEDMSAMFSDLLREMIASIY